jgi:hypothetical protein
MTMAGNENEGNFNKEPNFQTLNVKLDFIIAKLDTMEQNFESLKLKVDGHETKLKNIEDQVADNIEKTIQFRR